MCFFNRKSTFCLYCNQQNVIFGTKFDLLLTLTTTIFCKDLGTSYLFPYDMNLQPPQILHSFFCSFRLKFREINVTWSITNNSHAFRSLKSPDKQISYHLHRDLNCNSHNFFELHALRYGESKKGSLNPRRNIFTNNFV